MAETRIRYLVEPGAAKIDQLDGFNRGHLWILFALDLIRQTDHAQIILTFVTHSIPSGGQTCVKTALLPVPHHRRNTTQTPPFFPH